MLECLLHINRAVICSFGQIFLQLFAFFDLHMQGHHLWLTELSGCFGLGGASPQWTCPSSSQGCICGLHPEPLCGDLWRQRSGCRWEGGLEGGSASAGNGWWPFHHQSFSFGHQRRQASTPHECHAPGQTTKHAASLTDKDIMTYPACLEWGAPGSVCHMPRVQVTTCPKVMGARVPH